MVKKDIDVILQLEHRFLNHKTNNPDFHRDLFYSFISVASILGILYTIFIGNVIVVGKSRYFIKNHDVNPELGEIFSGFKGNYLNVVKIMFLMDLKTLLWLFLFIVPGVIKAYEYSMIPYLLAKSKSFG